MQEYKQNPIDQPVQQHQLEQPEQRSDSTQLPQHKFRLIGGIVGIFALVGASLWAYQYFFTTATSQSNATPTDVVIDQTPTISPTSVTSDAIVTSMPTSAPLVDVAEMKFYENTSAGYSFDHPTFLAPFEPQNTENVSLLTQDTQTEFIDVVLDYSLIGSGNLEFEELAIARAQGMGSMDNTITGESGFWSDVLQNEQIISQNGVQVLKLQFLQNLQASGGDIIQSYPGPEVYVFNIYTRDGKNVLLLAHPSLVNLYGKTSWLEEERVLEQIARTVSYIEPKR